MCKRFEMTVFCFPYICIYLLDNEQPLKSIPAVHKEEIRTLFPLAEVDPLTESTS